MKLNYLRMNKKDHESDFHFFISIMKKYQNDQTCSSLYKKAAKVYQLKAFKINKIDGK